MRFAAAVLPLLLLLFNTSPIAAQETTGNIEGYLISENGEPVNYANIIVSGPSLPGTRGSVSSSEGYFFVPNLPPGKYAVILSHISYVDMTFKDIIVQLGRTTTLRAKLKEALLKADPIIVSGQRPTLDFSTAETSHNLTSEVLNQLPTPRDYREVTAILPHTNTSFLGDNTNVGGSTGSENQYFIEGVNVTDPFMASTGTRLPQNFVREVQVKKGGYEAEYGKATGGIINVITHGGGNAFDGQVFGFLSNNNIASDSQRGYGDFKQDSFARYDLGASLGGPIAHDKLWFFLAYNPTFANENLEIPGLSYYEDKTVSHLFAGKLSWRIDTSTNLDFAVFGDPTVQDKVGGSFLISPQVTQLNADPLLVDKTTGAITGSLSGRRIFGERAIVEISVSRVESANEERAATEIGETEVTYEDLYNSELSGGMQVQFDHHTIRWAAKATTTLMAGSHKFKLGVAYEDIALDEEWIVQTPDGRPGKLMRTGDNSWMTITLLNDFEISQQHPTLFIQDSWRVTDRLRVNAGLRWDGTYIINPAGDRAKSINDGYQPRAGIVYQLDEDARMKLFGSYGRFCEQIPMVAASWYFGDYYQRTDFYDQNPLPDFTISPVGGYVLDNSNYLSDDLNAPYVDEFTLGYEHLVGKTWKAGIRGIYRRVGEVIETSLLPEHLPNLVVMLGNPGKGELDHLPDPERSYKALEFTVENTFSRKLHMVSSYVLSETRGNNPGVFNTDAGNPHAHVSNQFILPEQLSEGLLPNDRTHVFKIYGSYAFDFGFTAGGFFTWQSGTPLSEYGGTWAGPSIYSHLVPRGTAGRTPSIWDASLRLSYEIAPASGRISGTSTRLLFDVFHLFGQGEPTFIDQVRYFGGPVAEPETFGPNPNFGRAIAYQPQMTMRFGIETSF